MKKRDDIEMVILEVIDNKEMTIDEICDVTKLDRCDIVYYCNEMVNDNVLIVEDKPVKNITKVDRKIVIKTVNKTFYRI